MPGWGQENRDKDEAIKQSAVLSAFDGRIDLRNLDNYANQPIPDYITKRNSFEIPVTDAGATLGRVLFYDKALSIDGTKSCASCHVQKQAFGSLDILSQGVKGGQTARHSMRLVNTLYANEGRFFWDKRAANLKAQVLMPLTDHNEHGFSGKNDRPDLQALLTKLAAKEYYQEIFTFAFGEGSITEDNMASALVQFVNSIQSFDSKFDIARAQNDLDIEDFDSFTDEENLGKRIYINEASAGGAGCNNCHNLPEFDIDPASDHNGVVSSQNSSVLDVTNTRSPTLRDLVAPDGKSNGPFMHDGSQATLDDVVEHYNVIPSPAGEFQFEYNMTLDPRLKDGGKPQSLGLSDAEKRALIAFLKTLTGSNIYIDDKWSDPFVAN